MRKREIALRRAEELKDAIKDYLEAKDSIPRGMAPAQQEQYERQKAKILAHLGGTEEDWNSYKWQLKNRISDLETLRQIIHLEDDEIQAIAEVEKEFRWGISPYYLALIDETQRYDPIKLQAIPTKAELFTGGQPDPMGEEFTNPAGSITRRYPDRVIINVTNQCAMYCRHCQRRRNIGEKDLATPRRDLMAALDYVSSNKEIRDVLLTGGDAFMLDNSSIAWLLEQLDQIPHVEIKRFGTRTPVTLPFRIDDELCEILSRHLPLYVNTQFNHPLEVTPAAQEACFKLARAGVSLGNQAVLLKGVNNDPFVMRKLNQELLKIMVRPYYIFHPKRVKGTAHFWVKIEEGLKVMEHLRGYTTGMAIPTYILNAPKGYGKVPLLPQYLLWIGDDTAVIRTWENRIIKYNNREAGD